MSANSSSSFFFNWYKFLHSCIDRTLCVSSIIAITVCSLLLVVPPCVYVVYLGLKRRRSGTPSSHSDVFTYNMVAIELMHFVGFLLCCCGVLSGPLELMGAAFSLFSINLCSQQLFHSVTCVERYLAVVHPVAYLGLRSQKGVRVRNVTVGCVWLLCFAYMWAMFFMDISSNTILTCCVTSINFVVISFCSVSVLRVLIGPGPGGEGRQRVDRAKKRAFYTITVILGSLFLKFVANVANVVTYFSPGASQSDWWDAWLSLTWLSLPSSLVLPLLFLHRAGKLVCCKTFEE